MQVVVLRWDHSTEDLTDSDITTEIVDRIKAGNIQDYVTRLKELKKDCYDCTYYVNCSSL